MTHHTDAERQAFEAVASYNGKWPKTIERDAKGNYLLLTTAKGWMWWQAARRAPAAPKSPVNVWQQAVDNELVGAHLGVAGDVTAEEAAKTLHDLICWNIEVATDPKTNGGKVLVPVDAIAANKPTAPVLQVTPEMIEAALEAYMPFGDMELAIHSALSAAPQPPEAAPVPQFSRIAQKKLDYLLEAGEAITGYAIENKDGRRGAIDCHGFVYWWQDAAAPQPPACNPSMQPELATYAAPVQLPEPVAKVEDGGLKWHIPDSGYSLPVRYLQGTHKLYTEQQVRELLAAHGIKVAP